MEILVTSKYERRQGPPTTPPVATGVLANEKAQKNGFLLRVYLSIPCGFGVANYCFLAKASRRAFWEVGKKS